MADDTRQPETTQNAAQPPPKGPANIMPGGMTHTAGGKAAEAAQDLTYFQAIKQLGPGYYLNFHKRPCVRDSQLTGIGAGFIGGSLAGILRRPLMQCCNIAVYSWLGFSCASYQYCQYQRSKERDGMRQARELMEAKRANIEAKRAARRKAREEQDRIEELQRHEEIRKRSWGYWINKNIRFW
ncbi:hypothetical protein BU24DRAFT_491458 [Aaosphaeria arxii CBS 175.79]|uniref:Cytochrome c oxidase assembly protein COX20, mitochondrial n=1 Tax=Aaosphaeria arxii CBS 175.79 TaxID=1450172 RepID=A0A6A5XZX8_9PLEO|nr:uncharacterized protein BU24DRAFT_491458 [Aaosphaeria arxii CBS 175.79]KAF2018506.1 hypothetical protein BU24DRAFT_491458 [Aaosphaeria arxii CBS 175.79]